MRKSEDIQKNNYDFIIDKIINPDMDRVEIMEISSLLFLENKESIKNKKLMELNQKVFLNDLNNALTASDNIGYQMPYDKWLLASGSSGVDLSWVVIKLLEKKGDADQLLNNIILNTYKNDVEQIKKAISDETKITKEINKALSVFVKIMEKSNPEECKKIKKEFNLENVNLSAGIGARNR